MDAMSNMKDHSLQLLEDLRQDVNSILLEDLDSLRFWACCALAAACCLTVLALLLAWGRRQQRCFAWVPPQDPSERSSQPFVYTLLQSESGEESGLKGLEDNASAPSCMPVLKAVIVSVVSYALLGVCLFMSIFSAILATKVGCQWRKSIICCNLPAKSRVNRSFFLSQGTTS